MSVVRITDAKKEDMQKHILFFIGVKQLITWRLHRCEPASLWSEWSHQPVWF